MSEENEKPPAEIPDVQGNSVGYGKPPIEHQFRPGESGNPAGRPSAGASVKEHLNVMAAWTEPDIRAAARSKDSPWAKRAAAERLLRAIEATDLADFDEAMKGATLSELRAKGIDTAAVKKLRTRETVLKSGEVVKESEIELHDRSGQDFDRVMDRTLGRPLAEDIEIRLQALEAKQQEAKR
jgi:hypothetical protein